MKHQTFYVIPKKTSAFTKSMLGTICNLDNRPYRAISYEWDMGKDKARGDGLCAVTIGFEPL